MSQSLEQIENYFQGTLNAVEAREFEKAIQNDPDFAKEVAFYMSSVATVKDQLNEEKKLRFRQVYDSSKMIVADQLAPSNTKAAVIRQKLFEPIQSPLPFLDLRIGTEAML